MFNSDLRAHPSPLPSGVATGPRLLHHTLGLVRKYSNNFSVARSRVSCSGLAMSQKKSKNSRLCSNRLRRSPCGASAVDAGSAFAGLFISAMLNQTRGIGRQSLPGQVSARAHWDVRLGAGPSRLGVEHVGIRLFRTVLSAAASSARACVEAAVLVPYADDRHCKQIDERAVIWSRSRPESARDPF